MKRSVAIILCILVVSSLVLAILPGFAKAVDYSMVRVKITTGNVSEIDITVKGRYFIDESPQVRLGDATYKVVLSGGEFKVYSGSACIYAGPTLKLRAIGSMRDGSNTIKLYNSHYKCIIEYLGDMSLVPNGTCFNVINHLYIEDYLRGVVAYEMSDSWPIEALKSQAVAARGYVAMRIAKGNSVYDIGDTSSDQVYRGYNPNHTRVKEAIEGTDRIVMKSGDNYVEPFYSATNGGLTESASGAWGGGAQKDAAYPYFTVKYDPYDRANPGSNKEMIFFPVLIDGLGITTSFTYSTNSTAPGAANMSIHSTLLQDLKQKLWHVLDKEKYSDNMDHFSILGVTGMTNVVSPESFAFSTSSELTLSVRAFNRSTQQPEEITCTISVSFPDDLTTRLGIFKQNSYRKYYVEEVYNAENVLIGFNVCRARYGHGVGLSQRGAQQMANEGMSYQDILSFYYSGMTFEQLNAQPPADTPEPPIPPPGPATHMGTVNASGVNVRSGPSTSFPKLGVVNKGEKYEVTALDYGGNYHQVNYKGITGYIYKTYLDVVPIIPQNTAPATHIGTVTGTSVNIRSGPSTSYASLGKAAKGTQFEVTAANYTADWHQIRYNGQVAYMHRNYLSLSPIVTGEPTGGNQQPEQPPAENPPQPQYTGVVKSLVNVRTGPSTSYTSLTKLAKGTVVQVTQPNYTANWHEVIYNGGKAYIHKDYLTVTPMGQNNNPPATSEIGTITAGTVNVRSGPSTSYNKLGTLSRGQTVEIIERGKSYHKIKYNSGVGYVYASYVKISSTTSGSMTATVSASKLNLRSGPGTGYKVLTTLTRGKVLTLLERGSTWHKVSYGSYTGYVYASYVKIN